MQSTFRASMYPYCCPRFYKHTPEDRLRSNSRHAEALHGFSGRLCGSSINARTCMRRTVPARQWAMVLWGCSRSPGVASRQSATRSKTARPRAPGSYELARERASAQAPSYIIPCIFHRTLVAYVRVHFLRDMSDARCRTPPR